MIIDSCGNGAVDYDDNNDYGDDGDDDDDDDDDEHGDDDGDHLVSWSSIRPHCSSLVSG